MSAEAAVQVEGLHRSFGAVKAVDGISFRIERGSVTGFIGANGAGKTTTMRILATLDKPDLGAVQISGIDALGFPNRVRARIGWMPDNYGTYKDMTVFDYLDFFARAYGLRGAERRARVREVMDFTDLATIADREIDKLSKGMGQRLCLGRTLLHDPDFLIMDEPAAGLDPKARIEFKNLVAQLKQWGKTLLISSHILSELGEMCDSLLFIDGGRIVHHGTSDSLLQHHTGGVIYRVTLLGDPAPLHRLVESNPDLALIERLSDGVRIRVPDHDPAGAADLLRVLVLDGLRITGFEREERRLEEAFVEIVKRGSATPPPLP